MKRNILVDLHTHSTASDGQYTPYELIQLAKQNNVGILALTDHDTTAGLQQASQAAQAAGIRFINGIELDTKYPGIGGRFHILGYGIHPLHPVLQSCCTGYSQQRHERAERILNYLNEKGMPLSFTRIEELAKGGVIGRPHFARAMLEKGYIENIEEAFQKYLDTPEFQAIDRPKPHPKEAIQMISQAGGLAVLAHPYQLKLGAVDLKSLLMELKSYGLSGLECYYSTHTPQQTQTLLAFAQELGFAVSGGSDFHGESVKPEVHLGTGIENHLHVPCSVSILSLLDSIPFSSKTCDIAQG